MKKLAIILGTTVLTLPATALAGHAPHCGTTATMSIQCERGVKVYRAQPLQYAPGQLAAMTRSSEVAAENRKLSRKLAMKARQIESQREDITDLEDRIDNLESRSLRRARSSQSIVGVGFGDSFFSPQRSPGFRNGFAAPRGPRGRRGHK